MATTNYTADTDVSIPADVEEVYVDLQGEQGEDSQFRPNDCDGDGGAGGRVRGAVPVTPGGTLYVRVQEGRGAAGAGGRGGGATDVRDGGSALADRKAVAAGGGGGSRSNSTSSNNDCCTHGADGGADTGASSSSCDSGPACTGASGGTQSAGGSGATQSGGGSCDSDCENGTDGSLGQGGDGGHPEAGGGGGGYYGGGGGSTREASNDMCSTGGAGGSNYDDDMTSVIENSRGGSTQTFGNASADVGYIDGFSATLTAGDDVDLAWNDLGAVEANYQILRATATGSVRGDYTVIDTVPDGTTTYTDTNLEDGKTYYYRVNAIDASSNDVVWTTEDSVTADLPAPTLDSLDAATEDEITVNWTKNDDSNEGEFEVFRSTDGSLGTKVADGLADTATSHTDTGLDDGTEYHYTVRRVGSAGTTADSNQLSATTVLPAATGLSVTISRAQAFLGVADISWTDNADAETAYRIEVDDGSGFTQVGSDLAAGTTSHTLAEGSLAWNTTYDFRIVTVGPDTTTNSTSVQENTNFTDRSNGFWAELVSNPSSVGLTDLASVDINGEHSALSDFTAEVPYDPTWEDYLFDRIFIFYDSELLFHGYYQRVESDEGAGVTRLGGFGIEHKLERGAAAVTYNNIFADVALQDYLDNHSNIGGTVTTPGGLTVDDVEQQNADTTTELNNILSPAATDPWEVSGGVVEVFKTLHFVEGEDFTDDSGSLANTQTFNGTNPSQGGARQIGTNGTDYLEWEVTTDYDIPRDQIGFQLRRATQGSEPFSNTPGLSWQIDGTEVASVAATVIGFGSYNWTDRADDVSGLPDPLPAGTHTLRVEVTASGTEDYVVDCVALVDNGTDSRFTPNYTYDNTVDGNDNLSGPEEYPEAVRVPFAQVTSDYSITAVTINATFNDTTGAQALGWSVDDGSTWTDTANTSSITDDAVATPSTTLIGSAVMGRTTDTRTTQSPTTGYNGQTLDDWQLLTDATSRAALEDERIHGDHLSNIQLLLKRAGMRMSLEHTDPASLNIEAFEEGDVTGEATWTAKNRTRTVDVKGYANKMTGYGARDSNGDRIEQTIQNDDEITRVGETVERAFVAPDIGTASQLKSEVRKRLAATVRQDRVRGGIDIWPERITPGKSYPVTAWDSDVAVGFHSLSFVNGGNLVEAAAPITDVTLTVAGWVRIDAGNAKYFMGDGGYYRIWLRETSAQMWWRASGGAGDSVSTSTGGTAGEWYFVAGAVDDAAGQGYIWFWDEDGNLVDSNSKSTTETPNTASAGNFALGANYADPAHVMDGDLSRAYAWSGTALTQAQLAEIANGGTPAVTPSSRWDFDEGEGSTVADALGSSDGSFSTGGTEDPTWLGAGGFALESIQYGFDAQGQPNGALDFEKPKGLGGRITGARAETDEVRDAI